MGEGTSRENEPANPEIHPQGNQHREGIGEKNRLGPGYPERQAVQMPWVLHTCGDCRRTSKTQEVCEPDIRKVEEIQYDILVAGFSPECAVGSWIY